MEERNEGKEGRRKEGRKKKESVIPTTKCQHARVPFEDTSISPGKLKAKVALQGKWPITWSAESNFRGTEEALVLIMPQQPQGSSRNKLVLEPPPRLTPLVLNNRFMKPHLPAH